MKENIKYEMKSKIFGNDTILYDIESMIFIIN